MNAPRLLVSGYYGFGNAGDEALLAGLAAGVRRLRPGAELTVLSANPEATEAEHGVRAAPRTLAGLRSELRRADLFISGGGGLLQDATSWRSPLYYLAVIRLARRAGLPTACVGQGIGPLRRRWVRSLVRRELERVEALAVRDHASAELLRALGVGRPVEITADLAFALEPPSEEEIARAWARAALPRGGDPVAALCLRLPPGDEAGGLADRLAGALDGICRERGLRPLLVPMQRPADLSFAARTAAAMEREASVVDAPLSAREVLALIGGCDLVVGMRLHALVFAALSGVPPVAISYDPKVDALMETLGLSVAASAADFDPGALAGAVARALRDRERISAELKARRPGLRRAALRNVELALGLLGDGGGGEARP